MKPWLKNTLMSFMIVPLAAKCGGKGGGGGGGSPSPSTNLGDWLTLSAADYIPSGALQAMHHVPVLNWFV